MIVCISGGNSFQSGLGDRKKILSPQFLHLDLRTSIKSWLGVLKALPGKKIGKSQIDKVGRGRSELFEIVLPENTNISKMNELQKYSMSYYNIIKESDMFWNRV